MGPFFAFYKEVLVLKNKYPTIQVATFSDNNLEQLRSLAVFMDEPKYFYAPGDVKLFQAGTFARKKPLDQHTQKESDALLDAVASKLHFDFFERTKKELAERILPSLKSGIQTNINLEDKVEEQALEDISVIEEQWKKQKRYIRFSAYELYAVMCKFVHLWAYQDIILADLENESYLLNPMREALMELYVQLKTLLDKLREALADAALGRLVLVPQQDRYAILYPPFAEEDRVPSDKSYDENVLTVLLKALTKVGLDSDYVEHFESMTVTQRSTLTLPMIESLREFVCEYGSKHQREFVDDLFVNKDFKQKEFATPEPVSDKKLPTISLLIGPYRKNPALERLDEEWERCRSRLTQKHSTKLAMAIVKLYDDANTETLLALATPACEPVDFEYVDPMFLPPNEFSSSLDAKPDAETASELAVQVKTMTKALHEGWEMVVGYMLKNLDGGARLGRAEHLADLFAEAMLELERVTNDADPLAFQTMTCRLITFLFIHYHSIENQDELSRRLECGLVKLLGAVNADMDEVAYYQSALALRQQLEAEFDAPPLQYLFRLFQTASSDVMKENDPVFLFLKNWIIEHCPSVRDTLFERSEVGGESQYAYRQGVSKLWTSLKTMGSEEKSSSPKTPTKHDFDGLLIPKQGLQKKM